MITPVKIFVFAGNYACSYPTLNEHLKTGVSLWGTNRRRAEGPS
jgi:hypothetical protein